MKKSSILIVQPVGQFAGSLKSLEEYVKLLRNKYNFIFITPSGIAKKRLKKYGKVIEVIGLSKFDNSQFGSYKGLRYLLLIREVFLIIPTFFAIFKVKKYYKNIKLIHFNEITLIPTIFLFKFFFKVPFILHCRTLYNNYNLFSKTINNFLSKNISTIVAIDNEIKSSLNKGLPVIVIRNIINLKGKNKKNYTTSEYLNIGFLGSFLKFKGLEDLIKVCNNLSSRGIKIKLILAGSYITNQNFLFKLFGLTNNIDKDLIVNSKNVLNLGHLNELSFFYNKIDILCFPSYLNALGRQVFEAGFFNKPSIVCLNKKYSDSFINKKTGLSFKNPGSLKQLEKLILFFYFNKKEINKMGMNAKKLIQKNFDLKKNLSKMDNLYNKLIYSQSKR